MESLYAKPPEHECPVGEASTYSEDLGYHCVDLYPQASARVEETLAATGSDYGVATTLLIVGLAVVFAGLGFYLWSVLRKK